MRFTCHDIHAKWTEYIYRELTEPEQALFVRHLEECDFCQAEEREWRYLLAQFDAMASLEGSTDVPSELVYRVKRQIQLYEDWSMQWTSLLRRWMAGTAAACLLFIGGLWHVFTRESERPGEFKNIPSPIQKSVLQTFYDPQILEYYRALDIFEKNDSFFPNPLANSNALHNRDDRISIDDPSS